MTTSPAPRPIAALDVPLPELEAYLAAFSFWTAFRRTESLSNKAAFALDAWLVTHPKAPVSVDADYPQWAAELAAQPTYFRPQEKR